MHSSSINQRQHSIVLVHIIYIPHIAENSCLLMTILSILFRQLQLIVIIKAREIRRQLGFA